jgi:hypothetical protein
MDVLGIAYHEFTHEQRDIIRVSRISRRTSQTKSPMASEVPETMVRSTQATMGS